MLSFFLSYHVSGKLEETTDAAGLLLGPDWDRRGRSESPAHYPGPLLFFDLEIDTLKQRVSESFPSHPLSLAGALTVCWLCHGLSALRRVQVFPLGVQILPLSC